MYEIIFDQKAIEFLEKLDENISKRIWNKIMSTKTNPHYFFQRLSRRKDYRLRIGDYRVISDIDDSKKKIEITFIGHRKNIYKKLV